MKVKRFKPKRKFWKILIKNPEYTAVLLKFMSLEDAEHWSTMDFSKDIYGDYILLFEPKDDSYSWSWVEYDENRIRYFEDDDFEYDGEVKLDENDLDRAEEYLAIKKYNL